jgi:20S proteasome subunit beta 5
MNRFVSKYSSSPLSIPQEESFGQLCGKWDAAQQLAFPSFDVPAVHNVRMYKKRDWQWDYNALY